VIGMLKDLQNPSTLRISNHVPTQQHSQSQSDTLDGFPSGLDPTQRLSQVRQYGLFSS